MPMRRITSEEFQVLASESKALDDETIVVKADIGLIKAASDSRRCTFKISSGAVDRDRDVINQAGWMLDNYLKNPVVLWGHQYGQPPIGTCTALNIKSGDLVAEAEFFDAETYPWADTIYRIVKAGGLRATSVGFRPKKYNWNADRGGVDIDEAELLEFSVVSVPANPEALIQLSMKMADGGAVLKDFVKGCERMLDSFYGCEGVWIPRAQVEKAFEVINKSGLIAAPAQVVPVTVEINGKSVAEVLAGDLRAIVPEGKGPEAVVDGEPVVFDIDEAKCGDETHLEILDSADALVLELADDHFEVDQKQIQDVLTGVLRDAFSSITQEVEKEVQSALDYARGIVR